ncbi:hypothetical protein E0Z10_g7353 [Xylaria hypoxylon]|uniref:Uncharacterized protein n=1 Tax=Xylaria hypoxylon TaxID=37992 RepID=A0A4Z0YVB7_9PEZI|nr:hypothetical protein E0Z10_g7353 [Xylaria hypoxylon]
MDPATIFQIVGAVVSLGDVVIGCITRLSALKAQFHDAPIIVTSMIGQLHMVKIAQDQLSPLNSPNFTHDARYRQLASQLGNALDSFGPILLALGQQLDRYEGIGADRMTARNRMGFLHGEREMTNLSILLDRQVNALNLLLSAIQCQTWTQQSDIITQKESQSILRLAQDCSSSLVGLEDVASFISENTAAISTQFEFDDVLRSTLLYQAAERSHLRQALRAKKTKDPDNTSTNSVIQRPPTSGFKWAFQAMKLSKPVTMSNVFKTQQQGIRVDIRRETILEAPGENVVTEEGPVQENSSHSNPGDSNETSLTLETGQSAQPLLNGAGPGSPRPHSSFGGWRKAFQRRTSNARDTKPYRHHQEEENDQPKVTKVLLLGTSGGGKSTLLNALRLCTEAEDAEHDESYLRTLVWHNALDSVRTLLRAMERAGVPVMASARTLLLDPCPDCDCDPALNPQHAGEVARTISSFHPIIFQNAVRRNANQLHVNAEYYIENINRLAEQAVHRSAPTDRDLLRTQVTTTGIHQTTLTYQGSRFCVYDVGGERSERKKWIHTFEDVSVVIFPVDTTGYERSLREDEDSDRMLEQFILFEYISNSHWFTKSNFIIIFTKIDLLEKYLEDVDVDSFLRYNKVISNTESRIMTVDEYLSHLEGHFRKLIRGTNVQKRFRFIRANLVDVEKHNPAIDIFDVLESFGTPFTPGKENLTLVEGDKGPSEKEPASREIDGISSESSSADTGRLPVGESEDANPLLIGIAQ